MLVVSLNVTQACNDKEQVVPMLEQLAALPASLGQAEGTGGGYGFLQRQECQCLRGPSSIEPFIAVKRDEHHPAPHGTLYRAGCLAS
jgi:hypothetical protein